MTDRDPPPVSRDTSARGGEASPASTTTGRIGRTWRGIAKTSFRSGGAVVDRGVFAGANFLLHLLLARWLSEDAYGLFVVSFAILWLFGSAYMGLVAEPMLVFGSGRYRRRPRAYLLGIVRGHVIVSAIVLGVVLVVASAAAAVSVAAGGGRWVEQAWPLAVSLAVATPLVMLSWLLRYACYLRRAPWTAAAWGVVYLVVMLAGVAFLNATALLNPATALLAMGVAGGLTAVGLGLRILAPNWNGPGNGGARVDRRGRARGRWLGPRGRAVVRRHWRYGRSAATADLLVWVPMHGIFVLAAWLGSLEASGSLRAMLTMMQPALQANSALGPILLPAMVRRRAERGEVSWAMRIGAVLVAGSAVFGIAVAAAGPALEQWLYGGRYAEAVGSLWVLALLPAIAGARVVLSSGLRAREAPSRVLVSSGGSAVAAIVLTALLLPVLPQRDTLALAAAMTASLAVGVGLLAWFTRRMAHARGGSKS